MGDPSKLRLVPASSAATPINWTHVPEATKTYLIQYFGNDWNKKEYKSLPATIGDLATMFEGTKFFGYFKSSLVTVLMDISEFGLQPTPPTPGHGRPVGSHFYMTCNEMWFLLFVPGKRDGIVGNSDHIRKILPDNDAVANFDDEDYDEDEREAEERAIAQAFDIKLEHEVSRGKEEMVDIT